MSNVARAKAQAGAVAVRPTSTSPEAKKPTQTTTRPTPQNRVRDGFERAGAGAGAKVDGAKAEAAAKAAQAAAETAAKAAAQAKTEAAAKAAQATAETEAKAVAQAKAEAAAKTASLTAEASMQAKTSVASQVANVADSSKPGFFERVKEVARNNMPSISSPIPSLPDGLEAVRQARDATDLNRQVDTMKPGDKFTLGGGFEGTYKVGKFGTKGQIEVECKTETVKDPKTDEPVLDPTTGKPKEKIEYKLSVDAEVLGGAGLDKPSGVSAKALVGLGGKIEYKLDTPDEVKRANDILGRITADASQANIAGGLKDPVSKEDRDWLQSKLGAVELKGSGTAELAGKLGVKTPLGDQVSLGGKGRAEVAMRIEFQDNGKPPKLVLKESLQVEVNAGAGQELGPERTLVGPDGMKYLSEAKVTVGANNKSQAKVEVETSFDLPTGISTAKLLSDPQGALTAAKDQMVKSQKSKVTVSLDSQGTYQGNGVGVNTEVSLEVKNDQLRQSGAMDRLMEGDMSGALRAAGKDTKVEAKITPYTQKGISLAPAIKVGPYGASWELESSRRTAVVPPIKYEVTAKDMAQKLDEPRPG
jgi:hypothetical protein